MHDLAYQSHARRYDLSYMDGEIRLHMPITVAHTVCEVIYQDKKVHAGLADGFRACGYPLGDLIPPGGSYWGFGGVLKEREVGDEIVWSGHLPSSRFGPNRADLGAGVALSCTLELALQMANSTHLYHDDGRKQLLSVLMMSIPDRMQDGFHICAPFSSQLVQLLPELSSDLPEIERTLHDAWQRMWGVSQNPMAFRVVLQPRDRLYVRCPGSSTGLRPVLAARIRPPDRGYDLEGCHVDGPLQQLTLLAGIARLNDLARERLRP